MASINVEALLKTSLTRKVNHLPITGTIVSRLSNNHLFWVWAYFNADEADKDPIELKPNIPAQKGVEFESITWEDEHPDANKVRVESPIEGFKYILVKMASGKTSAARGFRLFYYPENFVGSPDQIVRSTTHGSDFGNFHYFPIEIKFRKTIKEGDIMQACFYDYLLGKIQGRPGEIFQVVNSQNKVHTYYFKEYQSKLRKILKDIKCLKQAKKTPRAVFAATPFPFRNLGDQEALEKNDPSLIPGIGKKKSELLFNSGFSTLQKIEDAKVVDLAKIKSISKKSASILQTRIKALKTNSPIVFDRESLKIGLQSFQNSTTKIFIDFEGFMTIARPQDWYDDVFLFGVLICSPQTPKGDYIPFLAESPAEQLSTFKDFVKVLSSYPNASIGHFFHYESTHLKNFFKFMRGRISNNLIHRLVDLNPIIKRSVAFPLYNYGLKTICQSYFNYTWENELTSDEITSIFLSHIQGDKSEEGLQVILKYNESDLRALYRLFRWLSKKAGKPRKGKTRDLSQWLHI